MDLTNWYKKDVYKYFGIFNYDRYDVKTVLDARYGRTMHVIFNHVLLDNDDKIKWMEETNEEYNSALDLLEYLEANRYDKAI